MTLRRLPYGANYLNRRDMPELDAAIDEQILFRYSTTGPSASDQFETEARKRFEVSSALTTVNCTQALRLALMATKPKVGDKVYIPAVTFVAVAGATLSCGLIPVPAEVDDNYAVDPKKLPEDAERVIVAHMEGFVGPIPDVPYAIEDTAQAFGARHPDGTYAGAKGKAGVFSFHHAKVLTSGEGGLLITNDDEFYLAARNYHDHGSQRKHGEYPTWQEGSYFGENLLAGEAQSAIQLQQMRYLDILTDGLDRAYGLLRERVNGSNRFEVLERSPGDQKLSLRIRFHDPDLRDRAIAKLQSQAMPFWTLERYFLPEHPVLRDRQSLYADNFPWSLLKPEEEALLNDRSRFEKTKDQLKRTLCLPVSPEQSENVQKQEAEAFCDLLESL